MNALVHTFTSPKGNTGVSYDSLAAAKDLADQMDGNNCTNCTNCFDCLECVDCVGCRECCRCQSCRFCSRISDMISASYVLN